MNESKQKDDPLSPFYSALENLVRDHFSMIDYTIIKRITISSANLFFQCFQSAKSSWEVAHPIGFILRCR